MNATILFEKSTYLFITPTMKAMIETMLCAVVVASFIAPMPWFGVVPPVCLILTPLDKQLEPLSWSCAAASAGIALWAIITDSPDQPETLVLLAMLSSLVAPRKCGPISDDTEQKHARSKLE